MVPPGVTALQVDAYGASDGTSQSGGGLGGYISTVINVTVNETLFIYVGGAGSTSGTSPASTSTGYNGGRAYAY